MKSARKQRSERQLANASAALRDVALTIPALERATCVSIYASRSTEPGTLPLIDELAAREVRILIPMLGDGLQRGWGEFQRGEPLEPGAPGRPPEPATEFLPLETVNEADVVLCPALSADRVGNRLGQGAGWYDRALVHVRADALTAALVFEDELLPAGEKLTSEDHDRPVAMIITPSEAIAVSAAAPGA